MPKRSIKIVDELELWVLYEADKSCKLFTLSRMIGKEPREFLELYDKFVKKNGGKTAMRLRNEREGYI